MSLSSALGSAASGLAVNAKLTQIISSNVANALTEGYAPRQVQLSSTENGVKVDGITRQITESLLKERRLADAASGNATVRTTFAQRLETQIGNAETAGSLASVLSDFDTALIASAAQPDSDTSLASLLDAATAITEKFHTISNDIQAARLDADRSIANQVSTLNSTLSQISDLNRSITRLASQGGDASSLMDQRQAMIDTIAEIVPVTTVSRNGNQIAIFTTGGQTLLDGSVATIGFTSSSVMTASMTIAGGQLSGLTINGMPVSASDSGPMGGGTLGASFSVRDQTAPAAQSDLDALARHFIETYALDTTDSTLSTGSPGLFTDDGSAFSASTEAGLASRISVNALADPTQGGALWHLRDGFGATVEGQVGSAALLSNIASALTSPYTVGSGSHIGQSFSLTDLASEFLSSASSARLTAETRQSYAASRQEAATAMILTEGVDTDYELQHLMTVEQAYAANAQVISTIDQMMQAILEI